MRIKWIAFAVMLALVHVAGPAISEQYTYVDLVNRLMDLEALSVLPVPGEKCAQWSSWDRASVYDESTGKYVRWDANGDSNGMIRTENGLKVMAEIDGPGCIWRIWSARAESGHVKIYLDGADEPAVDLPFSGYFNRQNPPFVYESLVHTTANGKNCYVPIPFQKSCKIVAEEGWGAYYHFTYSTFPKGTVVPTFTRDLSGQESLALSKVDYFLRSKLGSDPAGVRSGEKTVSAKVILAPGEYAPVLDVPGRGAITCIKAGINPDRHSAEVLRQVVLRIYWDGEDEPSVWAPIGDFFGTAPGVNLYKSLPLGMTEEGGYSYWYMPYADGARVEIVNESSQTVEMPFEITCAPLTRPVERLARFHAKWHRDAFLPEEPERSIDWTMLKTNGRGRFCGVMLEVWNPRGSWWGEGDEKFFVDGEKFPSTFGTGSEDYFGYAWCCPVLFQNAFHNQTISQGNKGHISVNRWHIADNVPFQSSIEAAIEKYFPNDRPTLYAATPYFYLAAGQKDPYQPVPAADRIFYIQPEMYAVKGALEGEKLKVIETTGGRTTVQNLPNNGHKWSSEAQLWWVEAKPKDRLTVAIPVPEAGSHEIKAQFTKAADYGIFQLYLDGEKLGEPIDLYAAGVAPSGEMSLGIHQLSAGDHELTIEVVGANDAAAKKYLFGLDYVLLQPLW